MKVGILTLRFHSNFGFLMQAYAMQQIVKEMGHEPYTYYTRLREEKSINKIKQVIKNIILKLMRKYKGNISPHWLTDEEYDIIDTNTLNFIKENLSLTPYFSSIKELNQYDHTRFDAFIVGSDQVWREEFSLNIFTYYLDFVKHKAKKISYAASFGVSEIDYTKLQIKKCKKLIKDFSLVAVREHEGVEICKKNYNIDAIQVLDPTMLVDVSKYSELADKSKVSYPEKYIFVYILDQNREESDFISRLSTHFKMPVINVLSFRKSNRILPYPSVNEILKGFRDASFIVTDSFHASVFSILFNKQFYVLKNQYRGISRITTLLNTFGLTSRIVDQKCPLNDIDYSNINAILSNKKEESFSILNKVINE